MESAHDLRPARGPSRSAGAGRALGVPAVALALAVVLVAGLVAVLLGSSAARAATRLADVRNAVVVGLDGVDRPAVEGGTVSAGETVRTGADGAATLLTEGRRSHLPALSWLTVLDGVRVVLERGSVGVDVREGPRVSVTVGALSVAPAGVVRVDRGYATRVAVISGRAVLAGSSGDDLTVPTLHQVLVPSRTLPRDAAPLALLGDDLDAVLAPTLLRADRTLAALASGLDTGPVGPRLAAAVPVAYAQASLARTGPMSGAAARTSEIALPLAVARVSRLEVPEQQRYADVRMLRAQGGSWGVVAALVDSPAEQVGSAFAALLALPGTGDGALLLAAGAVPVVVAGLAAAVPAAGAGGAGTTTPPVSAPGTPTSPTAPASPGAPAVPGLPGEPVEPVAALQQLLEVVGAVPVPLRPPVATVPVPEQAVVLVPPLGLTFR